MVRNLWYYQMGQRVMRESRLGPQSLRFADDAILWLHQSMNLHALEQFAARCEAARISISTFTSKAMVLCQKSVHCSHCGGGVAATREEFREEKFKFLRSLLMRARRMNCQMDKWFVVASTLMLYQTIVVNGKVSQMARLSIY